MQLCRLAYALPPKLFNAVVDALEWIAKLMGIKFLWHYLDDFIIIGHPDTEQCAFFLHLLINLCTHLSIPLAIEKDAVHEHV